VRFPGNPVLSKADGVLGPGHNSVIEAPDGGLVIVYHQKLAPDPSDNRFICVDRMGFDDNGRLWIRPTPLDPKRLPPR
jgi:GH43 family beta-xylosidase